MAKDKKQSSKPKISLAYHLFLYKQEMRSRKPQILKLSHAKYQLINGLVKKSWNNTTSFSKEDQDHLVDSLTYSKKLKETIDGSKSKSESKKRKRNEKKK